jgi:DUF971 family protein
MEAKELDVSDVDGTISISWSDGHKSMYSSSNLRRECPCAVCKGEPGIFGKYYYGRDSKRNSDADPSVRAEEITSVGRYGLKISWSDRHDLGIYTFEYLRSLCECNECKARRAE